MKHRLVAIAAVATVAGTLALAPSADAATGLELSASTYHEAINFNLVGLGSQAHWYNHYNATELVVLRPDFEYYTAYRARGFNQSTGKPLDDAVKIYIVDGINYVQVNGGKWTENKKPIATLNSYYLNPANGLAKLTAIPGAALVGTGHYQVSTTPARANGFLDFEYGLTAADLDSFGVKTVTMNAWTDSDGLVVKYLITAHSAEENVYIVETFSDYNQPLTITAP
jgi:hypothetical protein